MGFFDRFYDVEWTVAIRPHEEGLDSPMSFRVLKNTWRYWCADPFAFDYEGKTYVFMEVLDKTTQKGMIGYRVIENGKVSPIRICIKTPHHLSYPLIFQHDGEIFMMPECFESKQLTVYRAVSFPDRWEPCETVFENKMVCDTNYLRLDGEEYLLTMPLQGPVFCYDRLELYHKKDGQWKLCPVSPMVLGADCARNGGHFFHRDGKLYRPSQNCGTSYGEELLINEVLHLSPDRYEERLEQKITVRDILPDQGTYDGIHTFNQSPSYDVIDLRKERVFHSALLLYFIRNKLRRK